MTIITIEDETRAINVSDIITLCTQKNVEILTDQFTGRIKFKGKRNDIKRLRAILSASSELEATIMLYLSKSIPSLRDTLIERICIANLKTIEDSAMFLVTKQEIPIDIEQ